MRNGRVDGFDRGLRVDDLHRHVGNAHLRHGAHVGRGDHHEQHRCERRLDHRRLCIDGRLVRHGVELRDEHGQ
jgi:hypothetical protein